MRVLEWGGIGLQQLLLQRLHWQDYCEDLRTDFEVTSSGAEDTEGTLVSALVGC